MIKTSITGEKQLRSTYYGNQPYEILRIMVQFILQLFHKWYEFVPDILQSLDVLELVINKNNFTEIAIDYIRVKQSYETYIISNMIQYAEDDSDCRPAR